MSSFKKFMYFIYTILFVLVVLGVIYNDSLIATFDLETSHTIWMFAALLGFILLMFESVLENIHLSSKNRSYNQIVKENTELKAKLYDDMVRVKDRNRDGYIERDETIIVNKTGENRPRAI
jgi:hypothetical protein